MNYICQKEEQEIRTAFSLLDKNQDGRINHTELKHMLLDMNIKLSDQDIQRLIQRINKSENGLISEDEFIDWMTSQRSKDREVIKQAFQVFDRDGNGYISKDELRQGMTMLGEKMSDEMLDTMLQVADLDKDGRINYEEFVKIL